MVLKVLFVFRLVFLNFNLLSGGLVPPFFYFVVDILRGFILLFFYNLGIYPDEERESVKDKENHCKHCPLRRGNWCCKNKEYKGIRGCGCYLPAKRLTESKCPLGFF